MTTEERLSSLEKLVNVLSEIDQRQIDKILARLEKLEIPENHCLMWWD